MADHEKIINRLVQNSAEIITEDEFTKRINSGDELTHYIGFEISGYVHLGQGIMSALVMKDLTDLGVKCTVWLADWHTAINDKLDGTRETAARIGEGYFTEAIIASYLAVGGNPDDLEFKLASDWYDEQGTGYWNTVASVMKRTTLARLKRSISIMGRNEKEKIDGATLLYPAMQVADIISLDVDIAHAGMDQRKAHVMMRDYHEKMGIDPKPMALHHPLLMGMGQSLEVITTKRKKDKQVTVTFKMSKSDPEAAVFVHDTSDEIEKKIQRSFCPEKDIKNNPIINWAGHILFWNRKEPFQIERKEEHGGDVEVSSYKDLEKAYATGDIHPMDLKTAVAKELIKLLKPVREHFAKKEVAAKKAELDKLLTKS